MLRSWWWILRMHLLSTLRYGVNDLLSIIRYCQLWWRSRSFSKCRHVFWRIYKWRTRSNLHLLILHIWRLSRYLTYWNFKFRLAISICKLARRYLNNSSIEWRWYLSSRCWKWICLSSPCSINWESWCHVCCLFWRVWGLGLLLDCYGNYLWCLLFMYSHFMDL